MVWPHFPVPVSSRVADVVFATREHSFLRNELVDRTVKEHCLNQVVQLLVPVAQDVPAARRLLLHHCPRLSQFLGSTSDSGPLQSSDLTYFRILKTPLHLLLHRSFVEAYVLTGDLTVLSECENVDQEDSLCLLPDGLLYMSLTEKSYHRLGVVGWDSILNRTKSPCGERHVIRIDLKDPLITSRFEKQKYYVKIFNSFLNSGMRMDLLIRWIPDPHSLPHVSPLSIHKYFHLMKKNVAAGCGFMSEADAAQIEISTCCPSVRAFENKDQTVPLSLMNFSSIVPEDACVESVVDDAQDWIGAQLSSIPTQVRDEAALDVNSFGFGHSFCQPLVSVLCSQAYGFFTPGDILSLLSELDLAAEYIVSANIPFIGVSIAGFENSPVSWTSCEKAAENSRHVSGENGYSLILSASNHRISDHVREHIRCPASTELIRKALLIRHSDAYDFSIERQ